MPSSNITRRKILLLTVYGIFGINMITITQSEFVSGWMFGSFTALSITYFIY
jgi:hypothetical protein